MNLKGLVREYGKRRSITLYLIKLPPILMRLFGNKHRYLPLQVQTAVEEAGAPMADLCYAMSIYCTKEDFDAYYEARHANLDYWDVREEVAKQEFHGDMGFTHKEVVEFSQSRCHGYTWADIGTGGSHGTGHHSGHHGGGSGHGGHGGH